MNHLDRQAHWEKIYTTKAMDEVSWFQPKPETSLEIILGFNLPKTAKIIDVGGGDSFLVDHLLSLGFRDLTILDVSSSAIDRAKERLGEKAALVKWIVADAASFVPSESYDLWHDRAAFHFLTEEKEISHYVNTSNQFINTGGYLVIGTFSTDGPTKCSGIEIKQYSTNLLTTLFNGSFKQLDCAKVNHHTPFNTTQNFIFCSFQKR